MVDENSIYCPNCGEEFESEATDLFSNIDVKYSNLIKLKDLLDKEIITKEEFEKEKKKILNK